MPTLRKQIIDALEREPLDLRDLSQIFRIREKEALEHLQHIARSVHPRRLTMEPASCRRCGFVFKKRERFSSPSRCPLCKSESVAPPRYHIPGRSG
jgi:predicted Zn-ribbon and HTH transcriptional regulator